VYCGDVIVGDAGGEPSWVMCRDKPCNLTLQHDVLESGNSTFYVNARAVVEIGIGYPVLFPPYEKKLFVRMPVRGYADVLQVAVNKMTICRVLHFFFPSPLPLCMLRPFSFYLPYCLHATSLLVSFPPPLCMFRPFSFQPPYYLRVYAESETANKCKVDSVSPKRGCAI
jgi:hypothetical protein